MRIWLDRLYDLSAALAGLCLAAILVVILVQVIGSAVGVYVRGTDAYAGYAMAGASFFALAHTLRRGEHIRVGLFIDRLAPAWRRGAELWCHGAALFLTGNFAWYAWSMVAWSYEFNAISDAQDRTPLWIPQLAMALGVSVLFIAFLDATIHLWRHGPLDRPTADTPAHSE